jgi:hypothetical protein
VKEHFKRKKNCALLSGGNLLATFRDNLSVPSFTVKNPKRKPRSLGRGLYREECGVISLSSVLSTDRVNVRMWQKES